MEDYACRGNADDCHAIAFLDSDSKEGDQERELEAENTANVAGDTRLVMATCC